MSDKINQIVEELKTLTLLEASELVSKIEETFGVDASASGGTMVMAPTGGAAEATEEKTEFNLMLDEATRLVENIKVHPNRYLQFSVFGGKEKSRLDARDEKVLKKFIKDSLRNN